MLTLVLGILGLAIRVILRIVPRPTVLRGDGGQGQLTYILINDGLVTRTSWNPYANVICYDQRYQFDENASIQPHFSLFSD